MGYIPENKDIKTFRDIPETIVENSEGEFHFRSLTNLYRPKEQYNNALYQVATGKASILDEHVERLEKLIEARGEYIYFVKRRIEGTFCECYDSITQTVRRKKCLSCYGTRIKGGYDLYYSEKRPDGKIIMASPFTDMSLKMEDYGTDLEETNTGWTLPWVPMSNGSSIFSYDFLVRYNPDGTELGRYYIQNVKPSRSLDNRVTYQVFKYSLADRPRTSLPTEGITSPVDTSVTRSGDIVYAIDIMKLNRINTKIVIEEAK